MGVQQYHTALVLWLAISIFAALRCSAQARGTVEFSPVVGAYFPTSQFQSVCFSDGPNRQPIGCPTAQTTALALGGRVTAWASKRIAVEGSLWHSPSTPTDDIVTGDVRILLSFFGRNGSWAYMVGGPAFASHEHGGGFAGVVGAGAHFRVAPRLAIRAEFEEYLSSLEGHSQWDHFLSLGVSVVLRNMDRKGGETSATPAP
jgi:hypothetical protein